MSTASNCVTCSIVSYAEQTSGILFGCIEIKFPRQIPRKPFSPASNEIHRSIWDSPIDYFGLGVCYLWNYLLSFGTVAYLVKAARL